MKFSRFLIPLISLISGMFIVSCDVHQFPEINHEPDVPDVPDVPEDTTKYVDVILDLNYKTDMYLWEHFYDPKTGNIKEIYPEDGVDVDHPGTSEVFPGMLQQGLKYSTIRFYRPGSMDKYLRHGEFLHNVSDGYDTSIAMRAAPGTYEVVVWSDLIPSEESNRYYLPDNFHSIKIDYDYYTANSDYRDTYRGRTNITVPEGGGRFNVNMTRPMAKYEFITTDLSEFLDRETARRSLPSRAQIEDYKVMIYYSTYHPSAYSAIDDRLENSSTGVNFQTSVTVNGETEASLGFDYVFINNTDEAAVQVTIVVYDPEGARVAGSQQLTVPLRRDHHTLLRGAFLSAEGQGGIGLDPSFNGNHNVIL